MTSRSTCSRTRPSTLPWSLLWCWIILNLSINISFNYTLMQWYLTLSFLRYRYDYSIFSDFIAPTFYCIYSHFLKGLSDLILLWECKWKFFSIHQTFYGQYLTKDPCFLLHFIYQLWKKFLIQYSMCFFITR